MRREAARWKKCIVVSLRVWKDVEWNEMLKGMAGKNRGWAIRKVACAESVVIIKVSVLMGSGNTCT